MVRTKASASGTPSITDVAVSPRFRYMKSSHVLSDSFSAFLVRDDAAKSCTGTGRWAM